MNGQILRYGVEVRRRWAEYFEQALNMVDVREANINLVGNKHGDLLASPVYGLNTGDASVEHIECKTIVGRGSK